MRTNIVRSLLTLAGTVFLSMAAHSAPTVVYGVTLQANPNVPVINGPALAKRNELVGKLTSVYDEDFEAATPVLQNLASLNLSFDKQGGGASILGTMTGTNFFVADSPFAGRYNTTSGGSKFIEDNVTDLTLDLGGGGASAFGIYVTDFDEGSKLVITIRNADTKALTVYSPVPETGGGGNAALLFWGFFDNAGTLYDQVLISMVNPNVNPVDAFGFDDALIGFARVDAQPTPTPMTAALLLVGGLAGLGATMRRRSR